MKIKSVKAVYPVDCTIEINKTIFEIYKADQRHALMVSEYSDTSGADIAIATLSAVYCWYKLNKANFRSVSLDKPRDIRSDEPYLWLGEYDISSDSNRHKEVRFYEDPLKRQLKKMGYSPEETVLKWHSLGWLYADNPGTFYRGLWHRGHQYLMIAFESHLFNFIGSSGYKFGVDAERHTKFVESLPNSSFTRQYPKRRPSNAKHTDLL